MRLPRRTVSAAGKGDGVLWIWPVGHSLEHADLHAGSPRFSHEHLWSGPLTVMQS